MMADPLYACDSSLANARDVADSVVVVLRGSCSFAVKAAAVQVGP
jgi:hypothetical protein